MNLHNAYILLIFLCSNTMLCAQEAIIVDLFENPDASRLLLNEEQTAMLSKLNELPIVGDSKLIKANSDIRNASVIRLLDENQKPFLIRNTKVEERSIDDFSWFGNESAVNRSILVVKKQNITASIRHNGDLYRLHPIGDGFHAFYRVRQDNFPNKACFEDHREIEKSTPIEHGNPERKLQSEPNSREAITRLDVLVAYTPAVKNASADVNALIQLAIDESNDSYILSGEQIMITMNLVHKVEVSYTETSNGHAFELDRLANPSDGFMDNVPDLRETYNADIVALLTTNSDLCGIASSILAGPNQGYCTVNWGCATGNYSFAHEIGHLQGARHDDDSNILPFGYGHGFKDNSGDVQFRTVMAVQDPNVDRLAIWSSNQQNELFPVPSGNSTFNNNVRVLNETIKHISNFRGADLLLDDNIAWKDSADFLTIPAKASLYVGDNSITAQDDFDVTKSSEDVEFQVTNTNMGRIVLKPGFSVKNGGKFKAFIDNSVAN